MATFSLSTASSLFKRKFGKLTENMYNSANVTTSQIKKDYSFTGTGLYMAIPLSFSGGVGSGSIPTAGVASYSQAVLSAKKIYAKVLIDRESIKASSNDEGAFVRGLKEVVKKGVESFMRNDSRMFYGNGDGSLGTTSATSGSNPYVLTFSAGYNLANFEEGDIVNVETGNTDPFSVDTVAEQSDGTLDVTVTRLSGSQTPDGTDAVFMQNSENNDCDGLGNVLDATSSTLYSITVARRWQATQTDASSATLDIDLMNQTSLAIEKNFGEPIDLIPCSYTQYRKILNLLEDQKRYPLPPRYGSDKMKAALSFNGVEFMTSSGPAALVPERFCPPDRVYFLNTDFITRFHRPDFGWFDDDGTVFLREFIGSSGTDSYSALYGGYYNNLIYPTAHGRIDALAT